MKDESKRRPCLAFGGQFESESTAPGLMRTSRKLLVRRDV